MKRKTLLLAGWGMHSDVWRPLIERLDAQIDPVLLEWNGAVRSDPPELPGVECAIGWSLGAMKLIEWIAQRRIAPSRLILLSCGASMACRDDVPGVHPRILQRMRKKLSGEKAAVLDDFFKNVLYPSNDTNATKPLLERAVQFPVADLEVGLDYLINVDLRTSLDAITMPALMLHGDQDRILPVEAGEWLQKQIPQAQWSILAGQGHALPLSAADEAARQIQKFLEHG
ncbi:alpha/beta fold hydrolase [Candidatus Sumerlaeota bacterium]|nr:alpha/beta fold hydrolase [Candidatus Sumerlaeota bacterium]